VWNGRKRETAEIWAWKTNVESETKQKEIEAKLKEAELNAQSEKEKADRDAKQKEMELSAWIQKEKADRNAQIEKEKTDRDSELKKLQMQLQSQATESQSNTSVDGSGDQAVSHVPNIKLMEMPPFHEEKDDLDAYLNRFERTCRAFNVPQGQWSFHFISTRSGIRRVSKNDWYQRGIGSP